MTNAAAQELGRLSNQKEREQVGEEAYRERRREIGRLGGLKSKRGPTKKGAQK